MASSSARKEKRASLSALDPPLSPIAEEGAVRKTSAFRRFFSTRSSKKKIARAATLDTSTLARTEKIPRPRNLSFDLPTDDSDPGVNSASSSSAASTCSDRSYGRRESTSPIHGMSDENGWERGGGITSILFDNVNGLLAPEPCVCEEEPQPEISSATSQSREFLHRERKPANGRALVMSGKRQPKLCYRREDWVVLRTISSDGAGLLEPISSQTKAFSCMSINSNGNTDESDGPLRMSMALDEEGLARDPRTVSKHKYFSPTADRNIISKYIAPTFHERARSFRKLFDNLVPSDEQMLASYSCAYQREILVQGRVYISSRHICFHANIFGWGTIFVIPLGDVTEITKEKTMMMFPNSIQLNTDRRGRFFFASFTNRDKSLRAMQHAWNQIHSGGPPLTPDGFYDLMNPAVSTEDAEKEEGKGEEERSERTEEKREKTKERKDKGEKKDKMKEKPEKRSSKRKKGSCSVSSTEEPTMLKTASAPNLDPTLEQQQAARAAAGACAAAAVVDEADAAERSSSSSTTTDISMTECICDDHSGKKLLDQVFPRSQSELFDLIFTTSPWYVQLNSALKRTAYAKMPLKYTGYSASDWATNKEGVRQRTCTYTMALNHAMAPKSCIVTEKQVYKAFPGGFTIIKETVNSGVPYSDSFHVSCTYCVMGYGRGQARLTVHGGLVFSKSVWGMIRGYIERSTTQGLAEHYDALHSALTEECKRSAAGADGLALEDDQNRMDTSSEEGGEAEAGAAGNLRGMAGSISGINFVQHAVRAHEEPCFEFSSLDRAVIYSLRASFRGNVTQRRIFSSLPCSIKLPLVGHVRRVDFYGVGILALLSLMSLTLILLVLRLPSSSSSDSRLAEAFQRYLTPGSAPPSEAARPDLDSLIAAIGRIGAQLQQVRDAAAGNARPEL